MIFDVCCQTLSYVGGGLDMYSDAAMAVASSFAHADTLYGLLVQNCTLFALHCENCIICS